MALLKGTLEVLVLKTLSWGPMHGFEIINWIETRSNRRVDVTDAALVQALHRLEARKLVRAEWGETRNGRQARFYSLTVAGRAHLKVEAAALTDHVEALTSILAARSAKV